MKLGFEQEIHLKKQLFFSSGRSELLGYNRLGVRTSTMLCSAQVSVTRGNTDVLLHHWPLLMTQQSIVLRQLGFFQG